MRCLALAVGMSVLSLALWSVWRVMTIKLNLFWGGDDDAAYSWWSLLVGMIRDAGVWTFIALVLLFWVTAILGMRIGSRRRNNEESQSAPRGLT